MSSLRKLYEGRGFRVLEVQADGDFPDIEADISPIKLDIVSQDEHVPEV